MEEYLIRHCSPTLAGLKTSNMFSLQFSDFSLLKAHIDNLNLTLNSKGVSLKILKNSSNRALVFVYRESKLKKDLLNSEAYKILKDLGYSPDNLDETISLLSDRLRFDFDFPHEIGLFLGYPVKDVVSFINDKEKKSCLSGFWKVYHNPEEAKNTFNKFKKCTSIYLKKFNEGFTIVRLTVAA